MNRIAMVTGANKGIGFEVSRQLCARGAAVIVRLATLDDDGPTGAFFDENGPMPW